MTTESKLVKMWEAGEFDVECAVYWYAANYHDGQTSALYSVLSTSPYKPGALERVPTDCTSTVLYDALVDGTVTVEGLRAAVGVSNV